MSDKPNTTVELISTDEVEFGPVEAGEHRLKIVGAEYKEGTASSGRAYRQWQLRLDPIDEEFGDTIYHTAWMPSTDPNEDRKRRLREESSWRKHFCQPLELDPAGGWDETDLIGLTFYGLTDIEDDPEYGRRAQLKKIIGLE